jgi:hypothetical protein
MMDKPKCVCGCPDALTWRKAIEDKAATAENKLDQVAEIVDLMGVNDLSYREATEALHRIVGAPKAAAAS